jgi:hypothetical protein
MMIVILYIEDWAVAMDRQGDKILLHPKCHSEANLKGIQIRDLELLESTATPLLLLSSSPIVTH